MNTSLVMTVIGPDRPGLVESIAEAVAAHEGNWVESRMAHLGGQFAGILRVELPADKEPTLAQALRDLEGHGLSVVVQPDRSAVAAPEKALMALEVVGHDRPGIVRQIARVMAARGVNVEELSTECVSAPMSGETLFKASAWLHVPDNCDRTQLRKELEKIAADLIVDITFEEKSPAQA